MRRLISLITFVLIFLGIYAREIYCTIISGKDGSKIIPNKEYLTDSYWDFITKDSMGNARIFQTTDEAINALANFGWYVVKTEQADTAKVIMGHKVDSYMEIKSSRENLHKLMEK